MSNFDKQFTNQKVQLSPTDESFMMNVNQTMFDGFSYTSENFKYPNSEDDELIIMQSNNSAILSNNTENNQLNSNASDKLETDHHHHHHHRHQLG